MFTIYFHDVFNLSETENEKKNFRSYLKQKLNQKCATKENKILRNNYANQICLHNSSRLSFNINASRLAPPLWVYGTSLCPSIYLYIYLSIYLFIYLSIYLSIYFSIYISIYLSIYLSFRYFERWVAFRIHKKLSGKGDLISTDTWLSIWNICKKTVEDLGVILSGLEEFLAKVLPPNQDRGNKLLVKRWVCRL